MGKKQVSDTALWREHLSPGAREQVIKMEAQLREKDEGLAEINHGLFNLDRRDRVAKKMKFFDIDE